MTSNRTPARVARETRRAEFARTLTRILLAHDVTDREVERLTGVSHQHVAQWRDPDAPRAMSLADALALPAGVRRALAEVLAGTGHVVAELPEESSGTDIDRAIEVQRAASSVLESLARGDRTPATLSMLRHEIVKAQRALVALERTCIADARPLRRVP